MELIFKTVYSVHIRNINNIDRGAVHHILTAKLKREKEREKLKEKEKREMIPKELLKQNLTNIHCLLNLPTFRKGKE